MDQTNHNDSRQTFRVRYAMIVLAVIAVVGAIICVYGLVMLRRVSQSSTWPPVKGVVVESHVEPHAAGMPGHNALVKYQYEVEQVSYSGTLRIHRVEQSVRWVERDYPAGKSVDVYYDPNNPAISVLERGDTIGTYQAMGFGLFLLLAGAGFLLLVARKNRLRRGQISRRAAVDSTTGSTSKADCE